MKSLIQLISQQRQSQSNIESIISDDFLEASLKELSLKPSDEKDIQKWLNMLTPEPLENTPKAVKLNFSMISQIAAAVIIGVSLAVLTPKFNAKSTDNIVAKSVASFSDASTQTVNSAQLTDKSALISNKDIALAKNWIKDSVRTQSAGIYEAANGNLYHAVEFNYLELPSRNGTVEPRMESKTEYIFIPVSETY